MQNSVRKALPLAIAVLLVLWGAAFAGDNAGVTISLDSPAEVSDIGPGATIEVGLSASGMVGVKQFDITLEVSSASAFDMTVASFAPNTAFPISPGIETPGEGQVKSGAASFGAAADGDGLLGTFTLTTASDFTAETEVTITVIKISLGPSSTDRDVFETDDLGLSILVNPPPPPVIEPTLTSTSAEDDASLDYSAVGEGDDADGSAGEVSFSVAFTDNTEAAAEGQAISWAITNNGSESVFALGDEATEIAAGADLMVETATAADGSASITLDAEGDKMAGTTSVSVEASTTAPNSDSVDKELSASFSATWDVPVAAELASFAAEVTPSDAVLLQWSVASQSNNLGWEVFRSTDNVAFERVGDLIVGDGTTDGFKSYSFTDSERPQADILYYYLNQVDLDGTSARSNVIEVLLSSTAVAQQVLPTANALLQNFPNPFNPETTISFDLSQEVVVTLTIYDMAGQVVRTLVENQSMVAGHYKSVWDGRNESGAMVGSGIYFYQLNAGDFSSMKKMTLLQ